MPTYEYRCTACGYEFEELQPITADPLRMCPSCSQPSLKRLLSGGTGLVFKGSGFYLTDYKNSQSSSSSEQTKKTSSASKSTTDSTTAATTSVEKTAV